jgi:hypothetical protein
MRNWVGRVGGLLGFGGIDSKPGIDTLIAIPILPLVAGLVLSRASRRRDGADHRVYSSSRICTSSMAASLLRRASRLTHFPDSIAPLSAPLRPQLVHLGHSSLELLVLALFVAMSLVLHQLGQKTT